MLEILESYHRMQFQGKPTIQTQENGEETHFGPDLGPLGADSGRQFFFKNMASLVTRYHGQLSSCTLLEKNNHPILRKFSEGRSDGQKKSERKNNSASH